MKKKLRVTFLVSLPKICIRSLMGNLAIIRFNDNLAFHLAEFGHCHAEFNFWYIINWKKLMLFFQFFLSQISSFFFKSSKRKMQIFLMAVLSRPYPPLPLELNPLVPRAIFLELSTWNFLERSRIVDFRPQVFLFGHWSLGFPKKP